MKASAVNANNNIMNTSMTNNEALGWKRPALGSRGHGNFIYNVYQVSLNMLSQCKKEEFSQPKQGYNSQVEVLTWTPQ
jgi:hypothetical protein